MVDSALSNGHLCLTNTGCLKKAYRWELESAWESGTLVCICRNPVGLRNYHTKCSKSEKDKYPSYDITYM